MILRQILNIFYSFTNKIKVESLKNLKHKSYIFVNIY